MKRLFLLALVSICGSAFCQPRKVMCTVYNPTAGQCDASPIVTADNSKIDIERLKSGELRWCAVSRDILKEYSYGDTIEVFISDGHPKNGKWVIHDTMNKRYVNYVDFLTYNEKYGKWHGKME